MPGTTNYNRLIVNEKRAKILRILIDMAGGVQKFARALNLSDKTVYKMQNGECHVREKLLKRALEKFGADERAERS